MKHAVYISLILFLAAIAFFNDYERREYREIAVQAQAEAKKAIAAGNDALDTVKRAAADVQECTRILNVLPCSPLIDELKKACPR